MRTLRQQVKEAKKAFDKTEDDLKALQSVGQIIGEVLRQLDSEKCKHPPPRNDALLEPSRLTPVFPPRTVIVKASSGPRYVVGCRNKVNKDKLVAGARVALDMTTLTIMRHLPREVSAAPPPPVLPIPHLRLSRISHAPLCC